MNLFRIVQKRTNKRKEKGSPYGDVITVLLFVFLLPYVISTLLGHIGEETETFFSKKEKETNFLDEQYIVAVSTDWGSSRMTMQEYLIKKLRLVLSEEENDISYEQEALKAQAVLLRTELWGLMLSGENPLILQDDAVWYYEEEAIAKKEGERYENAVRETDGIFLAYEGLPVKAAFFPVSNGQTREAADVWPKDSYPYLVSVECSQDILSEKFQSQSTFSKEEYCHIIGELFQANATTQILWDSPQFTYDSVGYVIEAEFHGDVCSGETFRNAFGLKSASFRMERQEDAVVFHVKGVGHGFGMSQYGANEKAILGETFDEILKDFFFHAELEKIE